MYFVHVINIVKLIRTTVSVFLYLVVLFYCHFIWFYLSCLNLINGDGDVR